MTDFGIQIPIYGSNADRTVEALMNDPELAGRRESWLVEERLSPVDRETLLRVHDESYIDRLLSPATGFDGPCEKEVQRTFELIRDDGSFHRYTPESAQFDLCHLRDQSLRLAAGTVRGARLALEHTDRFCFYLGGGMHHGQYRWGEGFCLVNDLVIAVRAMQAEKRIRDAWIIDVDAHKGDGTAALTENDESVRTLSVHMADGWPMDQPKKLSDGTPNPSFIPSTIDVPIAAGEEEAYLSRLMAAVEEMGRRYPLPEFVLVVDGADPYERDQLPSAELLQMSAEQLFERDRYLHQWVRKRKIPALFVMAGNYGYHSWEVYAQFLRAQVSGELDRR